MNDWKIFFICTILKMKKWATFKLNLTAVKQGHIVFIECL